MVIVGWGDGDGECARERGEAACFPGLCNLLGSGGRAGFEQAKWASGGGGVGGKRWKGVPAHDVRSSVGDDAVGRATEVSADAQLVAHGSAHDQQSGFVAGELGNPALEVIGGGIFAENIVEQGCVGYGC